MEKVIAITGASSGIGEATAKLLAASGARVVLGLICASTGLKLLPLRSDKVMLEGAVDGVYGDRKQGILGRSPEPLASHKCCAHGRRKMPTYFCTTVEGRLTTDQKSRIAGEITRIHCEVTGAPSFFAQVIFQEVKHENYFMGGAPLKHDQIFVYGHIRSGRADVDKSRMITLMAKAVGDAAKAESSRSVWVYVAELPPRQMIEFGHLLPEAGDEPAWTAALPASDREFMQSIGK